MGALDAEAEDLAEFGFEKDRLLQMNTILLQTLHGIGDFMAASQVGPTTVISFENVGCFSAILPSIIPEGNPGADDAELWEECQQNQGVYAWAKAFETLEEQLEQNTFNLDSNFEENPDGPAQGP